MGEKNNYDMWGLSLSLSPPITHFDKKPCKRVNPDFSTGEQSTNMHKPDKTVMRAIDQYLKPKLVIDLDEMEVNKISSPSSTLSSASGKRLGAFTGDRDTISDDDEGGSGGGGDGSGGERGERKKLRLSKEQIRVLEQAFREHTTLNTKQKVALARQVNLRPRQVEVWFQNRRARTKLKQTEVDCEYLRRLCETLTEQNRKLQKDVQELRAMKMSPDQSMMQGNKNQPATTLNMCPSCKSVSISSPTNANKPPMAEASCFLTDVLHRPVPLNLKKLSLTINNNRMFESHSPRT